MLALSRIIVAYFSINYLVCNIMKIKLLSFVLLSMTVFAACKEEHLPMPDAASQHQTEPDAPSEGQMQMGAMLNDPYRIDNMRQAYTNITGAKAQLQPTHRYMRFLPKNDDEYDRIKAVGEVLYDHPLHHEIVQRGDYYHDPELPAEAITWQYAVIPVDKPIPVEIQQEVIYEVFIPDYDADGSKSGLLERIEDEAMRLCGYADELPSDGRKASKWTACGTIKVWDDALRMHIPLIGAKVRARRFTHVEWGTTNANGYYNAGQFRFAANYDIVWEQTHYDIRDGRVGQAKYDGPDDRSQSWDLSIGSDERKQLMFATIHRAAYKMFYGNNLGMTRPHLIAGKSTKIACMDEYKEETAGMFRANFNLLGILQNIFIWTKTSSGNYRNTYSIFSTTAHELGHQAHARLLTDVQFLQVSDYVSESWAEAVLWAITKDEYEYWVKRLGNTVFGNDEYSETEYRSWPYTRLIEYTPIFIDLVDAHNQVFYDSRLPNDQVKGYTMKFLNDNVLPHAYGLSSLKTTLKSNLVPGVTVEQIDLLFEFYQNLPDL